MNWNGKGNGNRGPGAPKLGAACARARGEALRKPVMMYCVAAVAAREWGTGALGERESEGCGIGVNPWQSAYSLVGLRPGQVRESGQAERHPHLGISKVERGGKAKGTDQDG